MKEHTVIMALPDVSSKIGTVTHVFVHDGFQDEICWDPWYGFGFLNSPNQRLTNRLGMDRIYTLPPNDDKK